MPIHSQDIHPGRLRGIVEVTYAIILPKYSIDFTLRNHGLIVMQFYAAVWTYSVRSYWFHNEGIELIASAPLKSNNQTGLRPSN
jgi:hypothetical protein